MRSTGTSECSAPRVATKGAASVPRSRGRGSRPRATPALPAFLETAIEDNVRLYERLGFVVTATIDDPDLPSGWCMSREPA